MAKEGSTLSGFMDGFALSVSIGLQYGVPLKALVDKFINTRFEPSGFTGHPSIPYAKSVLDYIGRWLGGRFISADYLTPSVPTNAEAPALPATASVAPVAAGYPNAPTRAAREEALAAAVARARALFDGAPTCAECGMLMTPNGALLQVRKLRRHFRLQLAGSGYPFWLVGRHDAARAFIILAEPQET